MPDAQKPDLDLYADALVALAEASGAPTRVEQQALDLAHLFETHADLRRFVSDPAVADAGKAAALEEALRGRVEPALLHTVRLLFDAGLLPRLSEVVARYLDKSSRRHKRTAGVLETAVPLPDDLLARINEAVSEAVGHEVRLLVEQNAELIGGVRVRVGDMVIDGSIERQMADLRRALLG